MTHLIAHRGASDERPENSLEAISRARDIGVDWIEVDVHLSRDGEVVVHHDPDLMRSAASPIQIKEATAEELQAIRLHYPGHLPCRMPTLEEAIQTASPIPLCVEIKSDGDPRSLRLTDLTIDQLMEQRSSMVISFDDRVIAHARERLPAARVGMIRNRDRSTDAWRDGLSSPAGVIVLSKKITSAEAVSALRASGRSVWAYALDDSQAVRQHLLWGVDGVISNRPRIAGEALRS